MFRRLSRFALILALAFAVPSWGAAAFDQAARNTPAGSGTTATTGSFTPPGGANNYLVAIATKDTNGGTLVVTDSQSGTWTVARTNTYNDGVIGAMNVIAYRANPTSAGMTVTATRDTSGGMSLIVYSFTGADAPSTAADSESAGAVMAATINAGTGGFLVFAGLAASFTGPTALANTTHIAHDTGAFSTQFWFARTTANVSGSTTVGYSAPSNRHAGTAILVPDAAGGGGGGCSTSMTLTGVGCK